MEKNIKYKVYKKNKVVLIIAISILLMASVFLLFSLFKYNFNGAILMTLIICLSLLLILLNSTFKQVQVYKDYIIYKSLFKSNKYKLSDIRIKEIDVNFKSHDIDLKTYEYTLAMICDLNEKKLFKVDDSYINYDLFVSNIKHI